jgi:exonuclease VII small subunit
MEERIHELELEIARVEASIAHCEAALQSFVSAEETQRLHQELGARRADMKDLLAEWEDLAHSLQD